MKRGLVIGGGGSTGAFAGGIVEYLIKEKNLEWNVFVGTSTGSLLVPLISVNKIDELKTQYTSVTNKDIFNKKPFTDKGKLRILNALWRVIWGKTSLGEAKNLRKKLNYIFSELDFNSSILSNKDVFVTVTNITSGITEYKHQRECTYIDFCDWMLASCSVPLLFDIVNKDGCDYIDGGVLNNIPLEKAVLEGCTEIDVIILSSETKENNPKTKNMFSVITRTISLMNKELNNDDIAIGKLSSKLSDVKLNIYRVPTKLTDNSLFFDKVLMTKWWLDGYNFIKNIKPQKITIQKSSKI